MRSIQIISAVLLTGSLAACGGGSPTPGTPTIRTIELTPATASVAVGQNVSLTAIAKDQAGHTVTGVTFSWKSSSETVAKVAGGVVTGMTAGTANVTASANGVTSAPAAITVTQAQPQSSFDLTLSQDRLPVITGTSATLTVTVTRLNGFTGPITLNASNLPAGASAAPVTVAAGQTSATVTVSAAANAAHSQPTAVTLSGSSAGVPAVNKTVTVTVRGPAGSLDTTFGTQGIAVTPVGAGEDVPYAMAVQPDGKIVVAGRVAGTVSDDFGVVRYTRDGALDPTFGAGGKVLIDFEGRSDIARAVALQPDGKIVVAGNATTGAGEERFAVARLNSAGTLDASFGTGGRVETAFPGSSADRAYAALVQPDGKIVVGGQANLASNTSGVDFALARYTATGALDAGFGTGGQVLTAMTAGSGTEAIHALALQGSKIVAAGGEGDFRVARYTAAGTLDASFGTGGKVSAVFGAGSIGVANAVVVDAQNRLVLAGQSQNDTAAARLTENGALDASFGEGGKKVIAINADNWDAANGLAIQSDGKVVLGGWVYGVGSQSNFTVTRLTAGGQPDGGFGTGGTTVTPVATGIKQDEAQALALQPDERIPATRIVAAGLRQDSNQDFALTRYWP
ncbi:hypothetical protein [Deinococcus sonorensis]|uniref:BIG2 domain-containing protein n=2 Tax=Deinococcus sonorensis TaxID=309891 RepID=A0AAU7U5J9_9DEIO